MHEEGRTWEVVPLFKWTTSRPAPSVAGGAAYSPSARRKEGARSSSRNKGDRRKGGWGGCPQDCDQAAWWPHHAETVLFRKKPLPGARGLFSSLRPA